MKNFTLLLLLVFFRLVSISQDNFISGYIIKPEGDTVHGLIDYQNWRVNPEKISFREGQNAPSVNYYPMQIKGFCTSGRIYETAIVQVEMSPTNDQLLTFEQGFIYQTDTTFLYARFIGEKSLYQYITKDRKEQFYIRKDTSFELLAYKKYLVETDDNSHIYKAENKKYIGQLTDYLRNCKTLGYKLENAKYHKNSLDKIFTSYSACTGEKYDFVRKKEEKRAEFGMVAGMTLTKVNFSGTKYPYLVNVDYGLSYNFTTGIFFDYLRLRKISRWSLSNEFIFTIFEIEGQYDIYKDENNITKTHVNIGASYLKWHLLCRYKIPVRKWFLFINAGPTLGLMGGYENKIVQQIKFYDNERTLTVPAIESIRSLELGAAGGFGTRYRNFSLEARYEWGNGFSNEPELTVNTNRIYFLLGYRF